MSPLAEVLPQALLLITGLGLIGAAAGLVAELAWDQWQEGRRWQQIDRLARVEYAKAQPSRQGGGYAGSISSRRRTATRTRIGRTWEEGEQPIASLARPRS